MSFRISSQLYDKITHYATFPQASISLKILAKFGQSAVGGSSRRMNRIRQMDKMADIGLLNRVRRPESFTGHASPSFRVLVW